MHSVIMESNPRLQPGSAGDRLDGTVPTKLVPGLFRPGRDEPLEYGPIKLS